MFNLEEEFAKWRQEMASAGLSSEIVAELEEHLREDTNSQIRAGTDAPEALRAAIRRIGKPGMLRSEFDRVDHPSVSETIRRHKAGLLVFVGLGLVAAVLVQILEPAPYQAEAKLLVRHIIRHQQSGTQTINPTILTTGQSTITDTMSQQREILASQQLAQRVAEAIGVDKILHLAGGGEDIAQATAIIQSGLSVSVHPGSSVIHISFQHPDSHVLQPVLRKIIDEFRTMHVEASASAGAGGDRIPSVSNISLIQAPSPPFVSFAALRRAQALLVASGVLLGLVWIIAASAMTSRLKLAR